MKIKTLSLAIAFALPMTGVFAAALDRSGQSISPFLQPGNYFETGISILDPNVSGWEAGETTTQRNIADMADSYHFAHAAIKLQPTEKISLGLIYDQPFGAKATYSGTNAFVSSPNDPVLGALPISTTVLSTLAGTTAPTGNTSVEVDTQNLAMLVGFQPTENWNIYAGPVYQTVKADISLRGSAYSLYNGYDTHVKEDGDWGWMAGVAFQIPEIALKASLTYRAEIEHDLSITENIPLANNLTTAQANGNLALISGSLPPTLQPVIAGVIAANGSSGKTTITTPQSVNLDLQTGIMENTVAFANIRWVNWKEFAFRPYKFGKVSEVVGQLPQVDRKQGFNLVQYAEDQWSVNAGVGRKFNDKWAGNVSVGWDSGAGNPVTTLGPTEGYWNVGLGMQFSPAENYFVAGGVKYFWLGDAKAQSGAQAGGEKYVADFTNNHALAYGLKLGYRF